MAAVEDSGGDVEKRPALDSDRPDGPAAVDAASSVNERALLRKLDLRLLPAVGILYLLSFLDRSNGTHAGTDHGVSIC